MKTMMVIGLSAALFAAPAAFAQTAAPATPTERIGAAPAEPAAKKLSADSTVKELLDDARARKVLTTHVPLIVENAPNYPEILPLSLRALSAVPEAQSQGGLTADVLKKIETDLAAL